MFQNMRSKRRSILAVAIGLAMTGPFAAIAGPHSALAAGVETVRIFDNGNIDAVYNQPDRPTEFDISRPVTVARVMTYHWNDGAGTNRPGTISLLSDTGYFYGPWRAAGSPGQGGVPNAYWIATPNQKLPPGTYRVIDSDPATWSQNQGSAGAGIAQIDAYRR